MIKFIKAMLFVLASLVMALCLCFIPDSAGAVSVSYITVLGLYLGLDVAGMITKTAKMKKGEYQSLNVHKYAISSVCLIVNIVIAIYIRKNADVSTALTSFISAVMIVLGCIVGGLEGNRIATSVGKEIPDDFDVELEKK